MKRIIKPNKDLEERIISGMDSLSSAIDEAIQGTIIQPQQWPEGFGTTFRKSGEIVVGSFRNIVDLGNLQKSQNVTREGFKTIFEWDGGGETPPVLVHEGFTHRSGKQIPARRFTEEGIKKVDVRKEFLDGFNGD